MFVRSNVQLRIPRPFVRMTPPVIVIKYLWIACCHEINCADPLGPRQCHSHASDISSRHCVSTRNARGAAHAGAASVAGGVQLLDAFPGQVDRAVADKSVSSRRSGVSRWRRSGMLAAQSRLVRSSADRRREPSGSRRLRSSCVQARRRRSSHHTQVGSGDVWVRRGRARARFEERDIRRLVQGAAAASDEDGKSVG